MYLDFIGELQSLSAMVSEHYAFALITCLAIYSFVSALPLAAHSTANIILGILFGFATGLTLATLGSALAGLATFIVARHLSGSFGQKLIEERFPWMTKEARLWGVLYVALVRLISFVPFSVGNIALAHTHIKLSHFIVGSLFGGIVTNAIFVNLGARLGAVSSPKELVTWETSLAICSLAVLPIMTRLGARVLSR